MAWPRRRLARLFATLLRHSLVQTETNPSCRPGTIWSHRTFCRQSGGGLQVYIRLLFAYSQDFESQPRQPSRDPCLGVFSRWLRPERPDLDKEVKEWKGVLVTVVFRCELWRCPHQHIEGLHRAAENPTLTFKEVSGALYPRSKGRGFAASPDNPTYTELSSPDVFRADARRVHGRSCPA